MKIYFFFAFITSIQTFHLGTTFKFRNIGNNPTALGAIHKNVFLNCHKFLCPLVDEPVCVKVKFRDNKTSNVIVRLMNECERKYVKCTQGAKAVTIPMVRCDESESSQHNVLFRRKRSMWREVESAIDEFHPIDYITKKTKKPYPRPKARRIKTTTIKSVGDESLAAPCPKRCPFNKRRMICAKCSHGIYRSFLSFCHLKMYQCRRGTNDVEPVELVSRDSCIFSAPYLTDKLLSLEAIAEYDDSDPVVWYDYCRKQNLLGKHPKCIFR